MRKLRSWWRAQNWGISIPAYVTRPDADGRIGSWSLSAWSGLVVILLFLANAILWGVVGIVAAVNQLL